MHVRHASVSGIVMSCVWSQEVIKDGQGNQESQPGDEVDARIPPGFARSESAAEVDVGGERDDPGEHHAEESAAENVLKSFGWGPALEYQGNDDAVGRNEQCQGWRAFCA